MSLTSTHAYGIYFTQEYDSSTLGETTLLMKAIISKNCSTRILFHSQQKSVTISPQLAKVQQGAYHAQIDTPESDSEYLSRKTSLCHIE